MLEPHYNNDSGVHRKSGVITGLYYNEGLVYRQWDPSLNYVITEFMI